MLTAERLELTGPGAERPREAGASSAGGGRLPEMRSVTDLVYDHLRARILGELKPGMPLRLADLATELGVSTTPVRVAVERLRAEGLVEHRRGKGSRVAPISLADLRDIYAVRVGLESVAARQGAPQLSDPEIETMGRFVDQLSGLDHDDLHHRQAYLEAEWAMHEVCYGAARHPRLLMEIRSYRRQTERYFRLALAGGINARDDFAHQLAFFTACSRRDPGAAEAIARELLEWTVERVASMLERSSTDDADPVAFGSSPP